MKTVNGKTKKFIATVEEDKLDEIHKIAKTLEENGIEVEQVLSVSGIITGKTDDIEALNKFKSEGLKTIEESKQVKAI